MVAKYDTEKQEALAVARLRGCTLPYKIKTDEPDKLATMIYRLFNRHKIKNTGISTDPDGDAIWIVGRPW